MIIHIHKLGAYPRGEPLQDFLLDHLRGRGGHAVGGERGKSNPVSRAGGGGGLQQLDHGVVRVDCAQHHALGVNQQVERSGEK